jgi:ABC-type multidrug transport system fused ATPase/permease subunit
VKIDYIIPLVVWVGIYLLTTVGGTLSRYLSGKVYSQMYVDIATDVIMYSNNLGHSATRAMARAELAKEYIIFFKDRLPEVTAQLTATLGVIFALFFYDWRIALVCFAVVFPLTFFLNNYRKNVHDLQRDLHDSREDLYKFFEEKNVSGIRDYYQNMVISQIGISKWNALNYSTAKLLMMGIFIVVLFICVDVDKFSTGNIYAIVSYLWTFIIATDYLPGLMESVTSVNELNNRLCAKEN